MVIHEVRQSSNVLDVRDHSVSDSHADQVDIRLIRLDHLDELPGGDWYVDSSIRFSTDEEWVLLELSESLEEVGHSQEYVIGGLESFYDEIVHKEREREIMTQIL